MTLNRNTGLALGFGIGMVISVVFFSANWLIKNDGHILKTQALQDTTSSSPTALPTTKPIQRVVATPTAPAADSNDTITNRMSPSKDEVISDIQKNIQKLYGSEKIE